MICHVVLIRLQASVDEVRAATFLEDAKRVLSAVPGVRDLRVGTGLGVKDEKDYPYCLVMDFDNEQALDVYQAHPEHQRFVKDILGPIGDDKKVFDYRS